MVMLCSNSAHACLANSIAAGEFRCGQALEITLRRLPPLGSLRVFEAAERQKSFKDAGDELGVTASAVSHRVATLEEELGATLFVRHTRRIEVTPEGERLAAGVRRGLLEFRHAVTSINPREGTQIRSEEHTSELQS